MKADIIFLVLGIVGGCVGGVALRHASTPTATPEVVRDYEPVPDDKNLAEVIRMGDGKEDQIILNNDAGW